MSVIYANDAFIPDANLVLRASATSTASENNTGIDLGSEDVLVEGELIYDISAMDIVAGNESYILEVHGSQTSNFASYVLLQAYVFTAPTAASTTPIAAAASFQTMRMVFGFRNMFWKTAYRYVRVGVVIGGTTPSITYSARLSIRRK